MIAMDEFSIPISIPLDGDGYLSRECPNCERQFKCFAHDEGDPTAEVADQFFCPLCGQPAGPDEWWTPQQLEYAQGAAGPELDRIVQDSFEDAFKGVKGISFEANRDFTLGIPTPDALTEEDDGMVAVEPPCHPNEPLKVPEDAVGRLHCLICGAGFAA